MSLSSNPPANESTSGITVDRALKPLERLIGNWTTEATHPALPGVVVKGTASIEWLEGERFIIQRTRTEHPEFPDAISIIGSTERDRVDDKGRADAHSATSHGTPSLTLHYFDSRGVFRVYDVASEPAAIRFWRLSPGFSQRFSGTFTDNGDTIDGLWQLSNDDSHWEDDLKITFHRRR
ncbi:MAG TPA: hypothetical protein VMG12_18940 [Polyangiaceae bacterium]|nr:hypothetical protein [Polyangiaceae bacterium]